MDEQSGESKQEAMIGEEIGESGIEKLVPERGRRREVGVGSREKGKVIERSDQLFLEMMLVAICVRKVAATSSGGGHIKMFWVCQKLLSRIMFW